MIADWDDAYDSAGHIADAEVFPKLWAARAASYEAERLAAGRAALDRPYGSGDRERLDLFLPDAPAKGLVVYVHGGFWMRFDKSFWSHLAEGPVGRSWAVAVPSYPLAPAARVRDIGRSIASAIAYAARRVAGPIALCGHSAGGQLVARMASRDGPLAPAERARLRQVAPVSGLFDLRPLMLTRTNATLRLDEAEAQAESPAFLRQSELIANVWSGVGATAKCVRVAGRHHYDVIADLSDPDSALTAFVAP